MCINLLILLLLSSFVGNNIFTNCREFDLYAKEEKKREISFVIALCARITGQEKGMKKKVKGCGTGFHTAW